MSFLHQINVSHERIRNDFISHNRALDKIRSSLFLSGTYIRDYLLATDPRTTKNEAQKFADTSNELKLAIREYGTSLHPEEAASFHTLESETASYLDMLNQMLAWSGPERQSRGEATMETRVLPKRLELLNLTGNIERLNENWMEVRSQDISQLLAQFRLGQLILIAFTFGLGFLLAGLSFVRIIHLEKESNQQLTEIAAARSKLEDLSALVLATQENERRAIARELHDEVGQSLWAMSLGLDNLATAIKREDKEQIMRELAELREISNDNARVVRNMSLLLRPSMLDDLGLLPALNWLSRELSRNSDLHVDLVADDLPLDLPEEYKTCIYRVVQEALRNSSRHAHATQASISVRVENSAMTVLIEDNGVGFDPVKGKGLGILGMEERVKRIGGLFQVESAKGIGTTIRLELPLPVREVRQAVVG